MADDSDLSDNQYTTAPGLNTNSGRSPDAPVASIATLLRSYQLGPGDVIYVDSGEYTLATNIVLDASVSGVRIQGPTDRGLQAILNRGNTAQGSYVFEVNGAEDVAIANLGITGARHGVSVVANSGSSNVTIFGNDIFGNLEDGIRIESGNSHIEILDNRIFDNGYYGVELYSEDSLVRGNEVYSNSAQGWSWLAGIYARNASNRIENNVVHSNVGRGIYSWQSQVIGNTVSGHASSQSSGIYLENASAQDNVVYSNHRGIEIASNRDAAIVSNRIYNNTEGIRISGSGRATLQGNRIYSNATGVLVVGPTDWWGSLREVEALNNLIYSNTNIALDIRNKVGLNLANNTIYQPVGDSVHIDSYQDNPSGPAADSYVYNNIFWVEAGAAISVTDRAQPGLNSDYNLFHLTGEGTVGLWGGRYYDSWADWHFEVGFDANSLQADPLFTDAHGPDGVLGYSHEPVSPAEIINNGGEGFSVIGDWTEFTNAGYGGSYLQGSYDTFSAIYSWQS
jgi:parallel beta-helix repeat protein